MGVLGLIHPTAKPGNVEAICDKNDTQYERKSGVKDLKFGISSNKDINGTMCADIILNVHFLWGVLRMMQNSAEGYLFRVLR